jgi:hypothetical protein
MYKPPSFRIGEAPEISYTAGDWRLFVSQPGRGRPAGEEVFSTRNDDLDLKPGSPPAAEIAQTRQSAYHWFALMSWLYENDRIAPGDSRPYAATTLQPYPQLHPAIDACPSSLRT